MRGSAVTASVRGIAPSRIMVVVVELPIRVGVEIATTSEASDDLSTLEPADELTTTAEMSGAVAFPLPLDASPPLPLASTCLDLRRFRCIRLASGHLRGSALNRGDNAETSGWGACHVTKNRELAAAGSPEPTDRSRVTSPGRSRFSPHNPPRATMPSAGPASLPPSSWLSGGATTLRVMARRSVKSRITIWVCRTFPQMWIRARCAGAAGCLA